MEKLVELWVLLRESQMAEVKTAWAPAVVYFMLWMKCNRCNYWLFPTAYNDLYIMYPYGWCSVSLLS